MQIEITGHHLEVTDSLDTYIRDKAERLMRHFDQVINIHFILEVEKLRHKAEGTMVVSVNKIFAESCAGDMYAAIDALIDKLDRQIVKHKEKVKDHHRQQSIDLNTVAAE